MEWIGEDDIEYEKVFAKQYSARKKYPCPTCGAKNTINGYGKKMGYQCDSCCALKAESGIPGY